MATLKKLTAHSSPSDCCEPTRESVVTEDEAKHLAKIFKALGDPTRVRLFSLISASTKGEMCVCDLIEPVGLSQPTISHHMKLLVEAGLVTREKRGRWAYYSPVHEALRLSTDTLTSQ